jgi:hypothetical protein
LGGAFEHSQLSPQRSYLLFQSLKLTPQTIRRILAAPPDREDNYREYYNEKDFHKIDWAELYRSFAHVNAALSFFDSLETIPAAVHGTLLDLWFALIHCGS